MKKEKMTKKERLMAFKQQKAEKKARHEKFTRLAKYLEAKADVIVSNMMSCYHHDVLLVPDYNLPAQEIVGFENIVKSLFEDAKFFKDAPGRFSFSSSEFFNWAKNYNTHLWTVVPNVLYTLYMEGYIDFSYNRDGSSSYSEDQAYFKVIALK